MSPWLFIRLLGRGTKGFRFFLAKAFRAQNLSSSLGMTGNQWERYVVLIMLNKQNCNCEKYLLSLLKPGCLALLEQRIPNISGFVCLVHQSFMWFPWLNLRKSTCCSVTALDDFKIFTTVDQLWRHRYTRWPLAIVTSQWPIVPMRFLWTLTSQFRKEFVQLTSVPSFSSFIIEITCGAVNCLANDVIVNWPKARRTAQIMALIILQRLCSAKLIYLYSTGIIRNSAIWLVKRTE